ncbi:MAG: copper ion binding protein, partial [Candidatus Rokuibacteriota bacterium]
MDTTRIELPVQGMSCASCVARIEKGLAAVPGVHEARVNLAAERATLAIDPERVGVEQIARTIRELGYEVPLQRVTLGIGGMSCASCVAKIEKGLHGVAGVVRASVNLATERATIEALPSVQIDDVRRALEGLGYTARALEAPTAAVDREKAARERELRRLGLKTLVGAVLS